MNDPLIIGYQASELRTAAEFFTNWLPFLTKDLCRHCMQTLTDRIRSLDPDSSGDAEATENVSPCSSGDQGVAQLESHDAHQNYDCGSSIDRGVGKPESHGHRDYGSSADQDVAESESHDVHDNCDCDANSLGSWKDSANEWPEDVTNDYQLSTRPAGMSWADMVQEDELEEEGGGATPRQSWADECDAPSKNVKDVKEEKKPATLSRDQREYIRVMEVGRKKDFICLERIDGKIVNVLDGLELHTRVFSTAEQKRIVDFVYELQEKGRQHQFKERTYSEPAKWMRGKGRLTIQFGCCYNYAVDKNGNPPGILRNEVVDPIPHLFKVMIRRLVGWHVIPPTCVPDSCIVNIYEEGDCIPPHIDNHDFVRPFCTVSFLSECNILFGSKLKIVGPGEFSGSTAIPLPVGSVLVLKGNGADVAKHCVPSVPSKRISITFRKMDNKKLPFGFVPEPDLRGLQPLPYGSDRSKRPQPSKLQHNANRRVIVDGTSGGENQYSGRTPRLGQMHGARTRSHPVNRPRLRIHVPDNR